eukprot:3756901-Lingulodinium_polyedra.AAC.1
MGRRKRPGLDGRFSAELGLLPDALIQWLCDLFDAIEWRGEWEGVEPEGLLLPKPGGDQADPVQ